MPANAAQAAQQIASQQRTISVLVADKNTLAARVKHLEAELAKATQASAGNEDEDRKIKDEVARLRSELESKSNQLDKAEQRLSQLVRPRHLQSQAATR